MVDKDRNAPIAMRIVAVGAILLLALWGFVIGILPAVGCQAADSPPTSGMGVWYCSDAHQLAAWLYIGTSTLLPAAIATWVRGESLNERSWPTLSGGLTAAAISPVALAWFIGTVSR